MTRVSSKRRRFPPIIIQHAVWLYFCFTLSLRDVEEMLAHRGVDVSYEMICAWTLKFGQGSQPIVVVVNWLHRRVVISTRWSRRSPASAC